MEPLNVENLKEAFRKMDEFFWTGSVSGDRPDVVSGSMRPSVAKVFRVSEFLSFHCET